MDEQLWASPGRAGSGSVRDLLASGRALTVFGAASLLVYAAFAWRFSLPAALDRPLLDMGRMTGSRAEAGVALLLASLVAFLAYWGGYRYLTSHPASPAAWRQVIGWAVAFNLALLLMYPIGAADVFDNIIRGRMVALYGANPFVDIPRKFAADPFVRYAAWIDFRSAYGPLWESIAAGAARLAGNGLLSNVLVFKGVAVLGYAADAALIGWILKRLAPRRALAGVYFFAWNPLVLFETAGNGHNDSLMLLTVLLAIYLYDCRRHAAAVVALVAGALIKFFPAALIPLFVAGGFVRTAPRRRAAFIARAGLASLVLVLVFYLPFWGSSDPMNLQHRNSLFTTSVPALAHVALEPRLGAEAAGRVVNLVAAAALAVFTLVQIRRLGPDGRALPSAVYYLVLFYLLLACPWLQPWYGVWAVGLAALLDDAVAIAGAVLLSGALTAKYFLFSFIIGPRKPLPARPVRELAAFGVVLTLPLLYHARAVWARSWNGYHARRGDHPDLQ